MGGYREASDLMGKSVLLGQERTVVVKTNLQTKQGDGKQLIFFNGRVGGEEEKKIICWGCCWKGRVDDGKAR
jgi:hypothetical protein